MRRLRILLADDHATSRKGLRALLATYPSTQVICEATNGHEAVQLVEETEPDVVVMDIRMPLLDGLEATRRIKARWPAVKVVALTANASNRAQVLAAGADEFLVKGCPAEDLFQAILCEQATKDLEADGDSVTTPVESTDSPGASEWLSQKVRLKRRAVSRPLCA